MEREIPVLARWSTATGAFAVLLTIAALAEIGFAGFAVRQYYADRAIAEAVARENFSEPPPDYPLAAFFEALTQPSLEVTATDRATGAGPGIATEPPVIAAGVLAAALLGLVVAMLGWVWRAHANLVVAGRKPRYGPGKALMAYLLPFANLALAPDAMRDLYNRSHGEPEELVDAPVDDVTAWFAAAISGTVILSLLIAKYLLDIGSNLVILTPLWMEFAMASFAVVLLLSAALLFARLTRIVTHAQRELLPDPASVATPAAPAARPGVRLVRG